MRVDAALDTSAAFAPRLGGDDAAAAKDLEAWFVGYLSKELRSGMGGGPLADGAAAVFSDLFDQAIGKAVSEGQGIGLAEQIEAALARRGGASPTDAVSALAAPRPPGGGTTLPGLEGAGRVTSGFGARRDPFHGGLRRHDGIDVAAPVGTPIRAPRDGIVRVAAERGGYGNVVYLDHGDGTESRYAHCDALAVKPGQLVRAGEVLATVGATGRATGPHVHVELRANGVALDPSQLVTHLVGGAPEQGLRATPSERSELP